MRSSPTRHPRRSARPFPAVTTAGTSLPTRFLDSSGNRQVCRSRLCRVTQLGVLWNLISDKPFPSTAVTHRLGEGAGRAPILGSRVTPHRHLTLDAVWDSRACGAVTGCGRRAPAVATLGPPCRSLARAVPWGQDASSPTFGGMAQGRTPVICSGFPSDLGPLLATGHVTIRL